MKNDKLITLRVPSEVLEAMREEAVSLNTSVSGLLKASVTAKHWRVELRRNIAYHRLAIRKLKEVEQTLADWERVKAESKAKPKVKAKPKP